METVGPGRCSDLEFGRVGSRDNYDGGRIWALLDHLDHRPAPSTARSSIAAGEGTKRRTRYDKGITRGLSAQCTKPFRHPRHAYGVAWESLDVEVDGWMG